jgi:hypothetical protein
LCEERADAGTAQSYDDAASESTFVTDAIAGGGGVRAPPVTAGGYRLVEERFWFWTRSWLPELRLLSSRSRFESVCSLR